MNITIRQFIQSEKVAALCCSNEDHNPYCFNCFYAFDSCNFLLVFKSSVTSLHCKLMMKKPQIAGTILPAKLNVFSLKGIQFSGVLLNASDTLFQDAFKLYHKKFPFALAIAGDMFIMQIDSIKMTDNTKGFRKKFFGKERK